MWKKIDKHVWHFTKTDSPYYIIMRVEEGYNGPNWSADLYEGTHPNTRLIVAESGTDTPEDALWDVLHEVRDKIHDFVREAWLAWYEYVLGVLRAEEVCQD